MCACKGICYFLHFLLVVIMEEFCPGNERTSMNYHNQRKRTNSVLRECGEGSGVTSGGHECKKIKGLVSHELIHSLTDRKASTSYTNDKAYARRQHRVGFDGRGCLTIVPVFNVVIM